MSHTQVWQIPISCISEGLIIIQMTRTCGGSRVLISTVSLPPFLFPPGTEQTDFSSSRWLFRDGSWRTRTGQLCAALVLRLAAVLTEGQGIECRVCRARKTNPSHVAAQRVSAYGPPMHVEICIISQPWCRTPATPAHRDRYVFFVAWACAWVCVCV